MEGEKQKQASSSSSFTEIFGSKESSADASSSFSALFDPIIRPQSKPLRPELTRKSDDLATKQESVDNVDKSRNQKTDTSVFYQQGMSQPCHLSSSIYYGGQDIYITSSITEHTPGHSKYNRDGEESSKGMWDGGVYY